MIARRNCAPGGSMVFVVLSKRSSMFGHGRRMSTDRYRIAKDLHVFFYDERSVLKEFGGMGKVVVQQFDEPIRHLKEPTVLPCLVIICTKPLT